MPLGDPDQTQFSIVCPYCGADVELYLEPDVSGSLVQDCEVCCRPWRVLVRRRRDGSPLVTVERAQ